MQSVVWLLLHLSAQLITVPGPDSVLVSGSGVPGSGDTGPGVWWSRSSGEDQVGGGQCQVSRDSHSPLSTHSIWWPWPALSAADQRLPVLRQDLTQTSLHSWRLMMKNRKHRFVFTFVLWGTLFWDSTGSALGLTLEILGSFKKSKKLKTEYLSTWQV